MPDNYHQQDLSAAEQRQRENAEFLETVPEGKARAIAAMMLGDVDRLLTNAEKPRTLFNQQLTPPKSGPGSNARPTPGRPLIYGHQFYPEGY